MRYPNRQTIRLKGYDYSSPGAYFITFNAKDFYCYFGDIHEGIMYLSESGEIIDKIWNEIPARYENTFLDEYIIMPDHFHGIIWISADSRYSAAGTDAINRVRTGSAGGITGDKNPMLNPSSISNMIRWFKGRSSYEIRKLPGMENFAWHGRFYDHVIRNEESLERIRKYIINNPASLHERG